MDNTIVIYTPAYFRSRGYEWIFHNSVYDEDILREMEETFGLPDKNGVDVTTNRWMFIEASCGFWAVFKTDKDAIPYKLMGLGNPRQRELYK